MTAADYQQAAERLLADGVKDAWVGDWLIRALKRSSGGVTLAADHPSGIGCTARTPEAVARSMHAVDTGLHAVAKEEEFEAAFRLDTPDEDAA